MTKEEEKNEIISNIDRAINELVYEKTTLIKAYNYYHGKRDPEQFRHLEENYGIGTPTSVEFVPLVRKHIDVLIGEYLSVPVLPRITCKDRETVSNIHRDKQLAINKMVQDKLKEHLNNLVYNTIVGKQTPDAEIEKSINDLIVAADRNFISEYEIAAQNIIDWAIQTKDIDFLNKIKILLTDLLISGTGYYKTVKKNSKKMLDFKILNPINTFIDRNPEESLLKHSMRSVCRFYKTKDQILADYSEYLTKEDLEDLENLEDFSIDGSTTVYLRSYDSVVGNTVSDGILGGFEITPLLPYERNTSKYYRMYPVYEVE